MTIEVQHTELPKMRHVSIKVKRPINEQDNERLNTLVVIFQRMLINWGFEKYNIIEDAGKVRYTQQYTRFELRKTIRHQYKVEQ